MAFVDHHHRFVRVREVADLVNLGHVTVHGKHPIGHDDDVTNPLRTRFLEACLQLRHVVVRVAEALRLAQPNAVDDRGVVQAVADDGILRSQQGLEDPTVGVKRSGIQDGVFGLVKVGDALFELLVNVLRATNEPHA